MILKHVIDTHDEGLCKAYWTCGNILNVCFPLVRRYLKVPTTKTEQENYLSCIRGYCRKNGMRKICVKKDFSQLTGLLRIDFKNYKVKICFTSTDLVTVEAETIENE